MSEKIIKIKTLPSGPTAICCETLENEFSIELSASCIFLHVKDISDLISLLGDVEFYFQEGGNHVDN